MTKQEQGKKMGRIIAKTWTDQAFKRRLLADATAVLKEEGLAVPEGLTVKALENTEKVFNLILAPLEPEPEVEDQALLDVRGGLGIGLGSGLGGVFGSGGGGRLGGGGGGLGGGTCG